MRTAANTISGNKDGAKKAGQKKRPGMNRASFFRLFFFSFGVSSQAIENLVGPEALEPLQRLVQDLQVAGADAAHLFDGADVFLVELFDDLLHFPALFSQADAHRTA